MGVVDDDRAALVTDAFVRLVQSSIGAPGVDADTGDFLLRGPA